MSGTCRACPSPRLPDSHLCGACYGLLYFAWEYRFLKPLRPEKKGGTWGAVVIRPRGPRVVVEPR